MKAVLKFSEQILTGVSCAIGKSHSFTFNHTLLSRGTAQVAKSVATLVRHQRSALTALVDAACMERAIDHEWMSATYDAWTSLAVACTQQHQFEEKRGAPVEDDPKVIRLFR